MSTKKQIHYGNATFRQREYVETRIHSELFAHQSALMDTLLKSNMEGFSIDDVENIYLDPSDWDLEQCREYCDEHGIDAINGGLTDWRGTIRDNAAPQETYEWWLCSAWMCERLRAMGEVVIDNDYGCWWGRSCTGQAIVLDPTFWVMFQGDIDAGGY